MTRSLLPLCALALLVPSAAAAPREIALAMTEPLRFDPLQIEVTPSEELVFKIRNTDSTEQPHNFVLAKPGTQKALVELALALGAEGPAREYVPESDAILVHSKLLPPGAHEEIAFSAPAEAGVYPYVCTFPGHGFLMYGALYVGQKAPPLEEDPNLPPSAVQFLKEKSAPPKAEDGTRPAVQRMFMPDAGPAAIAVALPGDLNYCWDAGACKLRYVWRGDFIDAREHWKGNGNALAKAPGERLWSEAAEPFPFRFGEDASAPAAVKFLGYTLHDGIPTFRYAVNGFEISERITPTPEGTGIRRHFDFPGALSAVQFLVAKEGQLAPHCEGATEIPGGFELPDALAKSFTIALTPP